MLKESHMISNIYIKENNLIHAKWNRKYSECRYSLDPSISSVTLTTKFACPLLLINPSSIPSSMAVNPAVLSTAAATTDSAEIYSSRR